MKTENRGGKRENSGRKKDYDEKTKKVAFIVPEKKVTELKDYVRPLIDKWKIKR